MVSLEEKGFCMVHYGEIEREVESEREKGFKRWHCNFMIFIMQFKLHKIL